MNDTLSNMQIISYIIDKDTFSKYIPLAKNEPLIGNYRVRDLSFFLRTQYKKESWHTELQKDIFTYDKLATTLETAVSKSTYGLSTLVAIASTANLTLSNSLANSVLSGIQIGLSISVALIKAICDPWQDNVLEVIKRLRAVQEFGSHSQYQSAIKELEWNDDEFEEKVIMMKPSDTHIEIEPTKDVPSAPSHQSQGHNGNYANNTDGGASEFKGAGNLSATHFGLWNSSRKSVTPSAHSPGVSLNVAASASPYAQDQQSRQHVLTNMITSITALQQHPSVQQDTQSRKLTTDIIHTLHRIK